MSSNEAVTTRLHQALAPGRARWWQLVLNVAYMLVAGPRALGYLLALTVALSVDLPHVALRLVLAGCLAALDTAARTLRWLLRFGLRFVWVGALMLLVWIVQTAWWLCSSIGRAAVRVVGSVLTDIRHPHSAWQRAVRSMQREREPAQTPRLVRAARRMAGTPPIRWRGERLVDAYSPAFRCLRRQMLPERWIVLAALWRRLALWEGRHTMRWLNVDLPALESPPYAEAGRSALLSQLPPSSLGYLLLKLPLGALALALPAAACGLGLWLEDAGYTGAALALVLGALYVLHLMAHASARVARRAYSPSAAVRRLRAAEALAAHERGKAERAEQSRRDLIINVGHELRTPTASILGHVESVLLALDEPDVHMEPGTLRTYLGIVQREAERLSALVDDLLAVARAERDELQLLIAPVEAAAVINEVYEALAPLARRERQVTLIRDVQPYLPPVLADRQRLTQVLLNLVRNAVTYTPAGGIVSIACCYDDAERLRLTVADTGSGIAPADLARVFERFYRADASRARASGGFGLGLAIAQDLVEAMGGTIVAESVVGEGSSFHVSLPIAPGA